MTDRAVSDTPRTDAAMWGGYDGPVVVDADFARQLERELAEANACAKFPEATLEAIESLKRELAEAQMDASAYRNVLWGNGFVMCDIPECNCGSWHYRYGLPERMDEIREALREADVLDNSTGNLPLNAIKKLHMQRDDAQREIEVWSRRYADLEALYLAALKS